ncbi:MAG: hypothetical protein ACOZAN_01710 [Patescibacteria group bacterium]
MKNNKPNIFEQILDKKTFFNLIILWFCWIVLIFVFQKFVSIKLEISGIDDTFNWTREYSINPNPGFFLQNTFLDNQIAWDSEFYLAIAKEGYKTDKIREIGVRNNQVLPLTYGFMPLYPSLMRIVAIPVNIFFFDRQKAIEISGLIISCFSSLTAMICLYKLVIFQNKQPLIKRLTTPQTYREDWAYRSVYYLLIFPSAFFLIQIYSESLYLALSLLALVFMQRKHFMLAAFAIGFSIWTKAVGIFLLIPLIIYLFKEVNFKKIFKNKELFLKKILPIIIVLFSFLVWQITFGKTYSEAQKNYFGRSINNVPSSIISWLKTSTELFSIDNSHTKIYYIFQISSLMLSVVSAVKTYKEYKGISLYSLSLVFFSATTLVIPQSMMRYVLVSPSLFIFLGELGKNHNFDRIWTFFSILFLGFSTLLFTFNWWIE